MLGRGMGNTASLTRMPAPAIRRALRVLGRRGRARRGSARNTAVTLREAVVDVNKDGPLNGYVYILELVRFTVLVSRG